MLPTEILDYYRAGGERSRLAEGHGRLEFLRTWDVLTRVLPPAPALVLDVGGATGVYAAPLARAGYRVHLVDPVPEHVADASALPGVTATLGDARTLPARDGSADAVLLLGPLYHLPDRDDRVSAWREAARVLRPGGVAVAATISRFASFFDGFVRGFVREARFRPIIDRVLESGEHHNTDGDERWFTTAYFHRPEELPDEVADAGLVLERVVATESPLWISGEALNDLLDEPGGPELVLDMVRQIEDEPSLLGASSHLLAIARRA
ncbi:class I SAM-dependent methyltransferase [Rugosimonospora africana]|uniref:Methyltransferase n=1 Tax=Rugosimonospora africana TaxID=556532 RepID=A0A8J3QWI7_9ACTN|nr:class I SAM-dependent methyltransferase [Rugosimonospora africana]GIH17669.1 methyltransferase [Rugosimonospora africana]